MPGDAKATGQAKRLAIVGIWGDAVALRAMVNDGVSRGTSKPHEMLVIVSILGDGVAREATKNDEAKHAAETCQNLTPGRRRRTAAR
ncbi:hypothetical protein [Chromobacterium sp. IIBBL 290-4]|uniref:hypothetical protein n=1 Tax=Chromobacterium sp. IIBBL 290-4 TaxID=2953890 RepID=UPI0020B85C93|nr:hypothetical protein [Chromobacterium sp. IIBBL 290-4]UTH72500.1 hypothetical protein NKT35_13165 [Chromobacterium sp. IIBBL 290-4]